MLMFGTPEFAAIEAKIAAGDVTHDDLIDMLERGFKLAGLPGDRATIARVVHRQYPTQADVLAHLRGALASYAMAAAPHVDGTRH